MWICRVGFILVLHEVVYMQEEYVHKFKEGMDKVDTSSLMLEECEKEKDKAL